MPGSIGEQVQQVRNLKAKRMLPLMEEVKARGRFPKYQKIL
jgi:hypothetical protein